MILTPGVYCTTSGVMTLTSGALTLDGENNPWAEWVFQLASTVTTSANTEIILINGA